MYTPFRNERDNLFQYFSLMKSSENDFIFSPAFYLIMCPMKAQKIFLKIFIFKTVELVSFWCVKTHFGKLPMKWCIFRHNKIWLESISCRFWSNWDLDTLSTSKWLSRPQFNERYSCSWQKNAPKWSKNGHLWVISFQNFFF